MNFSDLKGSFKSLTTESQENPHIKVFDMEFFNIQLAQSKEFKIVSLSFKIIN
jgi:hypothetical protein